MLFGKATGNGELHVARLHLLAKRRPHDARKRSSAVDGRNHYCGAEREDAVACEKRHHLQAHAERVDQKYGDDELGNALGEHGEHRAEAIGEAVAMKGGTVSQEKRSYSSKDDACKSDGERIGHLREELVADVLSGYERHPPISREEPGDPCEVLDNQGFVEPHLRREICDVLFGAGQVIGIEPFLDRRRGHHAYDDEHQDRGKDEYGNPFRYEHERFSHAIPFVLAGKGAQRKGSAAPPKGRVAQVTSRAVRSRRSSRRNTVRNRTHGRKEPHATGDRPSR